MLPPAFFHLACILLAIGLIERSLGPHGQALTSFLALLAVLPPVGVLHFRKWRPQPVTLLVVAGIVGFLFLIGPARLLALSGALYGAALSRKDAEGRNLGTLLGLTVFGYALFALIRDYLTLWPILCSLSEGISVLVTTWAGAPTALGPSYSGLWLFVAFTIACLGIAFLYRPGPGRIFLGGVALLAAVPAALALGTEAPHHFHGFELRAGLGWRLLAFVFLLVSPGILTFGKGPWPDRAEPPKTSPRRAWTGWAGAGLALLGLGLLTWSAAVKPVPVKALLDRRGSFNLEPLTWGKYGAQASPGASLATLPPLMDALGFDLAVSDTIRAEDLADRNVLVIMNPTEAYSPVEHRAIWSFVERGGGLLVLGDHTDIMGTMRPINSLLEPCGLVLNFDSAIPLVDRWTWYGCMNFHPHPLTRSLRNEADLKTSVGASLSLPPHSVPLVSGRDSFSDAGNAMNFTGANLGNMTHDRPERKGDLFLAAMALRGRGKVILFGDTSPFQRTNVTYTYKFVAGVFTYLASPGSAIAPWIHRLGGGLLLLAAALVLTGWLPGSLPAMAVLSLVGALSLTALDRRRIVELPEPLVRGQVARVDLAHGNRVDLHAGRNEGLTGLNNHLWRQGLVPLAAPSFKAEDLATARVFVTIAPAFPFRDGEVMALRRFVERGGLLIVASGFEERAGARPLLREFGYDIGAAPIGAAHSATVSFKGHHVFMHESWPVLRPEGRGEVWVECWGHPLVVFERIGQGGLIVIGDSYFLGEVKTEKSETYVEVNINFLRTAIETAMRDEEKSF